MNQTHEISGGQNEKLYFAHSASLRIFGRIHDLDEMTQSLGIAPTHSHRKGDRPAPSFTPFEYDMWSYTAPVKPTEPLRVHIDVLWDTFKERKQYLLQLKPEVTVDVFLGYRSNCDNAGVVVPHESLEIFTELQVPLGLSIVMA